ncbi:keratin associated protein 5-1 [Sorangium cellulosum]|uniref:Keratin associated protein 5-1 n=1 Tax=Sorangium cellulosum TaxID=56 RepID=A0A150P203_SORCE|nr:keratin associated protein 5-1 [Sorangium cellulosum]
MCAALAAGCAVDPGGGGFEGGEDVGRAAPALSTEGQVCVTIQRGAGPAGVADAVLWQSSPSWNDGAGVTLSTGTSAGGRLRRSLLRFDISGLPPGAEVVSASLSLSQSYKTTDSTVRVHRVTSAWEESAVTWASFGEAFDPAIAASFTSGGGSGFRSSDITDLARAWASGEAENHGVLLEEDPVQRTDFRSSEKPLVEERPKLELCYVTCDDGIQNGDEKGVDCGGACPACDGQSFEGPPGGSPVDLEGSGATYAWSVGDINELPEPVARLGTHEPCTASEDCQFDQYCEHPAQGACAHNPCETGGALLTTCSGCVAKVCDANPGCCTQTTIPADCGHDACQTGAATHMTPTCGDPCIANICAVNPLCCEIHPTSSADCAALIGMGSTLMTGGRCSRPLSGICPSPTTLTNGACVPQWNTTCRNLVATQCPGKSCAPPTNSWNATCVALADQLCGSTCSTDPGQQRGLCKSYLPNETSPACSGVDLTVGVPCGGTIPVCNRGDTPAPAGIEIHSYPAGAGQLPSSAPSRILNSCSPTGGTLACTTAQPIAPGECISVAGCTGVADGMELIVNPPGPGQIAECQCANNGSVYQSAECASPGCVATASASTIRPVTLFVALDRSGSMVTSGGTNVSASRWNPAREALRAFFEDPASAGLGVAFRFWPHDNPGPCNDSGGGVCLPDDARDCSVPIVPFDGTAARRLTADPAPLDQQEFALVNALYPGPGASGDTPMYPALDGATTWAIDYKSAHPEEEVAVVFVTDGIPSHCDTVPNHIADLARNAFENHGVRVHAVGFGNSSAEIINLIATRGGGRAFNLTAGAALQTTFRDALVGIRGEALPCDVTVPLAGVADLASVSVVHVDNAGTETVLTPRADLAACGQGWYFADATNTSLKLCPQTCADLRTSPGKVRATVPCAAEQLSPITTSWERYHGVCPPGTKARWEYLTYRTVTPDDSSVELFVRAADDPADLDAAIVTRAATAHATPTDTQVCDETSTPPCAVDLAGALGGQPEGRADYLELQVKLNPTSDGAGGVQVQDWEIGYSCPDAE